jgi:hypothetical protein
MGVKMFDIQYENQLRKIVNDMEVAGYKIFVFGSGSINDVVVSLPVEIENYASQSERNDLVLLIKNDTVKHAKGGI